MTKRRRSRRQEPKGHFTHLDKIFWPQERFGSTAVPDLALKR